MIIVGLTGGIASGKSFIANYLKKLQIQIHESDNVVKLLYKHPTKTFLSFLKKNGFEKSLLTKKINKKYIREEILINKNKKTELEKFLHNEVRKSRNIFLKKNKKKKIVFLDIPLLFEKKLNKNCNYICSVIAPTEIRKRRALNRKNMTKEIFAKIVKIQTKDKTRIKRSDYLIDTTKSKSKTCLQVDNIIYDILRKKK